MQGGGRGYTFTTYWRDARARDPRGFQEGSGARRWFWGPDPLPVPIYGTAPRPRPRAHMRSWRTPTVSLVPTTAPQPSTRVGAKWFVEGQIGETIPKSRGENARFVGRACAESRAVVYGRGQEHRNLERGVDDKTPELSESQSANHVLIDATLDVTPRTPDVTPRTPTCRRTESGYFYSHARYRSTTCGRIARNTILIGQLGWVHTSLSDVQLPMAHAVAVIARCWSRTWLTHTGIFRT